jgi:hypothetical protein
LVSKSGELDKSEREEGVDIFEISMPQTYLSLPVFDISDECKKWR